MIRSVVLCLFFCFYNISDINAGERIELKSPVLYYECLSCTDTPNIYSPSYAVRHKPIVTDWKNYSDRKIVLDILKIPQYIKGEITLISKENFYPPEVRFMLIGLLDYDILVDRYGFVKIGRTYYKLTDEESLKLENILHKLDKI